MSTLPAGEALSVDVHDCGYRIVPQLCTQLWTLCKCIAGCVSHKHIHRVGGGSAMVI